ncbi:hypothetical protein GF342_04175 [Candidatus Woesearchaeota archaeon]|nr:hypothetical protein [Candidatus Woesearchaeota archaeon]
METYTPQALQAMREQFRRQHYPEIHAEIEGIPFSYFVLPQSLNPDLEDFAFCMQHEQDRTQHLYGVSDNLPEHLRPFWAVHEVIEYREHETTRGRCRRALKRELTMIPQTLQEEYLPRRRAFFARLIAYASQHGYAQDDINEFRASLEHLEQECKDKL